MRKVLLSCKSCYGVFEVSKSFFNGKDDPKFCAFCGKAEIVAKREIVESKPDEQAEK